jgi:hypothetical protein
MALLLLPLAFIIAIGLDFARAYHVATIVTNSARVGAEFGAVHGVSAIPADSDIEQKARDELGAGLVPVSSVSVVWWELLVDGTVATTTSPGPCDTAQVTVRTRFDPITPLTATFWPPGTQICRETVLRRNGPRAGGCAGSMVTPTTGGC